MCAYVIKDRMFDLPTGGSKIQHAYIEALVAASSDHIMARAQPYSMYDSTKWKAKARVSMVSEHIMPNVLASRTREGCGQGNVLAARMASVAREHVGRTREGCGRGMHSNIELNYLPLPGKEWIHTSRHCRHLVGTRYIFCIVKRTRLAEVAGRKLVRLGGHGFTIGCTQGVPIYHSCVS